MSTLLLGLSHSKNQELLANFLSQKYQVYCPDSLQQGLEKGFDLCILDAVTLRQNAEAIRLYRQIVEPVFLPILVILSRPQLAQTSKETLHQLVDEVLLSPIDQVETLFRIEALLRARQLSVKLHSMLEQEQHLEQELQVANAALQKIAVQDELTGLANRRAFADTLQYEFERARRSQSELFLMLCDIDHFKAYNDTYGHVQGDRCLQQVASILQSAVRRPPDLVARYGGEEFAIVLPDTSAAGTVHVARKIQAQIYEAHIPHQGSSTKPYITLSFGIGCLVPTLTDAPEILIQRADKALYQAKTEGRDRITVAANIRD